MKTESVFRSDFLEFQFIVGKYEVYLDGSTGWGITFPGGYLEVEEGPHPSVGWMNGIINELEISLRGYDVPQLPEEFNMGKMSNTGLSKFFDKIINKHKVP